MVTSTQRAVDRARWWEIHEKDSYICPDCGRTRDEHGRQWEVHHIDGVAGDCVALCKSCHYVRHGSEMKSMELWAWKEAFLAHGAGED